MVDTRRNSETSRSVSHSDSIERTAVDINSPEQVTTDNVKSRRKALQSFKIRSYSVIHTSSKGEEKVVNDPVTISDTEASTFSSKKGLLLNLKKKKPDSKANTEIKHNRKPSTRTLFRRSSRTEPQLDPESIIIIQKPSLPTPELVHTPPLITIQEGSPEKPKVRPVLDRSISFQSTNENEEGVTISPSASDSSSTSNEDPLSSSTQTPQNSPQKLRVRSRTVGASDYLQTHQNKSSFDFNKPSQHPNTPPLHYPQRSPSLFNSLTSFVRTRRSSSTIALNEIQKTEYPQYSGPATPSDKHEFSNDSAAHSDYFSQKSRPSSIGYHKHTSSYSSFEKIIPPSPTDTEDSKHFIERLLDSYPLHSILPLISSKDMEFYNQCLSYFMTFFDFSNLPLDVSLRKFLVFNELPKETQQIDRVLYAFSKEYCEQNPLLNATVDVYFILSFSLLILHTDQFNPNNKRKMTKLQFVRIVKEGLQSHLDKVSESERNEIEFIVKSVITRDVLGYFFDNITFTPFKRLDDCPKDLFFKMNLKKGSIPTEENVSGATTPDIEMDATVTRLFIRSNLSTSSLTPTGSRKRASSFFVLSSAGSEAIYDYILGLNDIQDLKLKFSFQKRNPFVPLNQDMEDSQIRLPYSSDEDNILIETEDKIDEINTKIFQETLSSMITTSPKTLLRLRFPRSQEIKGLFKSQFLPTEYDESSTFCVRVYKTGVIYRQEIKKLSSATLWRPYYAALTSVGLIFYKDMNTLRSTSMAQGNDKVTILDEISASSFFESSTEPEFSIYNHGLFATRMAPDTGKNKTLDSYKFAIYGKNSRNIYSVDSSDEMAEWICSINYLVSLNDCFLTLDPLPLEIEELRNWIEIRSLKSLTLLQKVNKSNKLLTSSLELLKKLFGICDNFQLLTPFSSKTRELATYSAQLLNTRIGWCWYELNKNLVMLKVLLYAIDNQENVNNDQDSVVTSTDLGLTSSLYREKTEGSVLLVIDYNIDNSLAIGTILPDSDSDSLYYDCNN